MEKENLTKNSPKIIKINKKTPNFNKNSLKIVKIDKKDENENYIKLAETQKFKLTLNYVIKLLKAKKLSVEDALNLLNELI